MRARHLDETVVTSVVVLRKVTQPAIGLAWGRGRSLSLFACGLPLAKNNKAWKWISHFHADFLRVLISVIVSNPYQTIGSRALKDVRLRAWR